MPDLTAVSDASYDLAREQIADNRMPAVAKAGVRGVIGERNVWDEEKREAPNWCVDDRGWESRARGWTGRKEGGRGLENPQAMKSLGGFRGVGRKRRTGRKEKCRGEKGRSEVGEKALKADEGSQT